MIQITTASPNDVAIISLMAEQIWRPTYYKIISEQQIKFMLKDMYRPASIHQQMSQGHTFKLLSLNKNYCGFASFSETSAKNVFKIHKLYLQQNYQGMGLGKALLGAIENEVGLLGASEIQLHVNRANKAQFFYLKMGFKILETVDTPYHHFLLNDYIMQKKLYR
ncbi:MAG: GNAT family N-acetyltransferase [Sphingobacteriales bacterium]|nr:MAG: GNAT family N-acetyltransferase [Sphingobacteriales bacterium]TAF82288.1 MAG: GNAT family N-acetyltransferase [Sphingobacteriales bacterium]